jgi:hypothetical protein
MPKPTQLGSAVALPTPRGAKFMFPSLPMMDQVTIYLFLDLIWLEMTKKEAMLTDT